MEMSGLLHQITSNWVNNTGGDVGNDEFRSLGYQDTLFPFLIICGGSLCVFGLILIETAVKRPRRKTNFMAPGIAWIDNDSSCNDIELTQYNYLLNISYLSGNPPPAQQRSLIKIQSEEPTQRECTNNVQALEYSNIPSPRYEWFARREIGFILFGVHPTSHTLPNPSTPQPSLVAHSLLFDNTRVDLHSNGIPATQWNRYCRAFLLNLFMISRILCQFPAIPCYVQCGPTGLWVADSYDKISFHLPSQ